MSDEKENKPLVSIDMSFGEKIDAALGDAIRNLLMKPAEEAGNLLANSIGIYGDKILRKRLLNTKLSLEQTRATLESKGIDLKDITPPSEEELHVVLDGMSLSGDDHIRKLWAGLLASSLSPESSYNIERPITSAISALSPIDARIISFVALIVKENISIQKESEKLAGVDHKESKHISDLLEIDKALDSMGDRMLSFVESVKQMEKDLQLDGIHEIPDWLDNLSRLGIMKVKTPAYRYTSPAPEVTSLEVDGKDLAVILSYIEKRTKETEALALEGVEAEFLYRPDWKTKNITLGVELTRFGEKLCDACGLL